MMMIRLMTYNIHKAIGGIDRRYRPERIIETIAHYDPDVVFLQEVDDGVPRSRLDRQIDLIGDALEYRYRAYQANVKLKRGNYGNAILSRFPMRETWNIDLTIPLKKRRQALIAKAHINDGGHDRLVVLSNIHLGLAGFERIMQLTRLMTCDPLQHIRHDTPLLIGGDFNDVWGSLNRRVMVMHGFENASGKSRTFPAFRPMRSLDAIYYRGRLELESSLVGHTALARQASDHLPLIAEFRLLGHEETTQ